MLSSCLSGTGYLQFIAYPHKIHISAYFQSIIERELALYGVSLDKAHLDELTGHVGASNPEWLCVACHEVAAMDRVTEGRIAKLPEDLTR